MLFSFLVASRNKTKILPTFFISFQGSQMLLDTFFCAEYDYWKCNQKLTFLEFFFGLTFMYHF